MTKKQLVIQYKIIAACTFLCGLGLGAFLAVLSISAGGLLP
tara:strand:+ start:140 stop:262 length:123 start_codon:yes stop_codon:yes gene_type:complete